MHLKYFADSYEYVKRALITAIAEPQEWVVHPMLFRSIDGGRPGGGLDIAEYAAFLETRTESPGWGEGFRQ